MEDTLKQLIILTETSLDEWKRILNDSTELEKVKKTKDEVSLLVNHYIGKYEAYVEVLNYVKQNEKYDMLDSFGAIQLLYGRILKMVNKDDLKKEILSVLKDNLFVRLESISKDTNIPFGPVDTVKVSIYFGEELLNHSSCAVNWF